MNETTEADLGPTPEDLARDLAADLAFTSGDVWLGAVPWASKMARYGERARTGWPAALRRAIAAESKAAAYDLLLEAVGSIQLHDEKDIPTVEALLDWVQRAKDAEVEVNRLQRIVEDLCARVVAQSELLTRCAGKGD